LNTGALLNVTLDSDASVQGHTEGYYTLNSMGNEKQNWIQVQGSNAIWYDTKFKNWKVGDREDLGSSTCYLTSTNDAMRPEKAGPWKCYLTSTNDAIRPEEAITSKYGKNGDWVLTSNIFGSLSMC
jgi:hypothetical protein